MFKLVRGIPEGESPAGDSVRFFPAAVGIKCGHIGSDQTMWATGFSWPLRNLGNWVGTGRRDIRPAPPVYRP